MESELFGHEKGSFTGAVATKPGLFEVADGGTLFIDEIGELAGSLQAKLLRVLEDGSLRRVGSLKERRVDVRLLAATNRDMAKEVAEGRFREDLYYRINVMSLQLPPLREREGDIPLLVKHILGKQWTIEPEAHAGHRGLFLAGQCPAVDQRVGARPDHGRRPAASRAGSATRDPGGRQRQGPAGRDDGRRRGFPRRYPASAHRRGAQARARQQSSHGAAPWASIVAVFIGCWRSTTSICRTLSGAQHSELPAVH